LAFQILGSDSPDLEAYLRRASLTADKEASGSVISNKRKIEIPVVDLTDVKHFKPVNYDSRITTTHQMRRNETSEQ